MNDTKSKIITLGCSFIPYVAVVWGYVELTNGGIREFWSVLGVLFGARLFFSFVETIGSILAWRVHGKSAMIHNCLEILRTNKFPMREYAHDNLGNYLARIDGGEQYSAEIQCLAKELSRSLELTENMGILSGMRLHAAWSEALDIYSPKESAPNRRDGHGSNSATNKSNSSYGNYDNDRDGVNNPYDRNPESKKQG